MRVSRTLIWLFLLPAAVVLLLVVFYPFVYNLYISTTNMGLYTIRDYSVKGLSNYRDIFLEKDLWYYFGKTLIWTFVNLFFHMVLGISIAMLLNRPIAGRGIFRALLILPWAMPQYISALTWKGMFNYQYGAINLILTKVLHLPAIQWFSSETWAFIAPIITNIWLGFPFIMVVTLEGLQSIPRDLYEAAALSAQLGYLERARELLAGAIQKDANSVRANLAEDSRFILLLLEAGPLALTDQTS